MSGNIDIFLRLPDVADIGRTQLQVYCNEWLQRPIAQQFGISHLIVGSNLLLTVNLDAARAEVVENQTVVPICELLDYIIDRHFQNPEKRSALHADATTMRQHWDEVGYQYGAMAGRVGRLWLKCKNPNCDASMETSQEAIEGQTIHCPPCEITCPVCGHAGPYDGNDLKLIFAK
jgi:hypothetical protein